MFDRLDHRKESYAVIANPCYTGSYFELNPDLVIISEMGLGIVELKHHFGEVSCSDPSAPWRVGGAVIEAGHGFINPHRQVQSYANQIRSELAAEDSRWLPGTAAQRQQMKIHTTVCFTNPFVRLDACREAIQYHYAPGHALRAWEKFSVCLAAEIPDWAMDMRFEVSSEADWYRSYQLLPAEIGRLAAEFFHARSWEEMEKTVRRPREPYAYLIFVDERRPSPLPPLRVDREEMFIGRSAGACNLVIPQAYTLVSNRHARIFVANRRFYFEDLGSTNGSYLLDRPERLSGIVEITPDSPILLGDSRPGDKVCMLQLNIDRLITEHPTEHVR